ncbi:MAG: hypothetical protein BMS9Abin28_1869 [Anaerolineae bacterium]|nr:MAG: hypothetical protein BMS9Abin28_1869 [Anaerolineae bacterium]
MQRIALLLTLAILLAGCRAPRRQRPAPTLPTEAPAESPALTVPQDTPSPTALPVATPTQEPRPEHTPVRVTPGSYEVVYRTGEYELKGYLCLPKGEPPFPAVIYNHGGLGDQIGGAPAETCEALAEAGFVGFSPLRRPTMSMEGHLDDVLAGVDYVKDLGYVDLDRLAIMGFSRGGLLTFMAGTVAPDDFKAIVIMAPAVKILEGYLAEAGKISAPVLLLVSENDNVQQNHIRSSQELNQALLSAEKQVEFLILPPYQDDGHMIFFEVGEYWKYVSQFLQEHL